MDILKFDPTATKKDAMEGNELMIQFLATVNLEAFSSDLAQAKDIGVSSADGLTAAAALAFRLRDVADKSEKIRKEIVSPWNGLVKNVNSFFKQLVDPATEGVTLLKKKSDQYTAIEQAKVRAEEARRAAEYAEAVRLAEMEAQKKHAEAVRLAELEAKKKHVAPAYVPPPAPVYVPPPIPVRQAQVTATVGAGSSIKHTTWKYEIENLEKIPIEYWEINHPLIVTLIAKGLRDIPGIRIYSEENTQFRRG